MVSRWLWPANKTEVFSMVVTWWIMSFCAVKEFYVHDPKLTGLNPRWVKSQGAYPANNITSCSREYDVPRGPGNVAFTLGFTFSSRKNVGTK